MFSAKQHCARQKQDQDLVFKNNTCMCLNDLFRRRLLLEGLLKSCPRLLNSNATALSGPDTLEV